MNPLLLCIDTAGSRCAVAVHDMSGGRLLARADPDIGRGHAELLMTLVGHVLAAAGAAYADIGKIAAVVGPGSFTGLRVGVAAAKGLCLGLDVPAVGVTTLEAMAEPLWPTSGIGPPVLSVIDAKRGEVYAALYGGGGRVLRAPSALTPDALRAFVAVADGPVVAVGSGMGIATAVLGGLASSVMGAHDHADIAAVARIGAMRAPSGPLRPLYLRGADAKPQAATGVAHATRPATLP